MDDLNILKRLILIALKRFLEKESDLLVLDAREEAISHRLSFYMEKTLENSKTKWDFSFQAEEIESLVVDCEYNKHKDGGKVLSEIIIKYPDKKTDIVRPDIILHKRNSGLNLVIIEVKKKNSREKQYAKDKVQAFVESSYNYQLGIYIEFNSGAEYSNHEKVADIATFSNNDYKIPNKKLLNMLNVFKNDISLDLLPKNDTFKKNIYEEKYFDSRGEDYDEALKCSENLIEDGWYYPEEGNWSFDFEDYLSVRENEKETDADGEIIDPLWKKEVE